MAESKPKKEKPVWKYTSEGTGKPFIYVEGYADGRLDYISPQNPSPEVVREVTEAATKAGLIKEKPAVVPKQEETISKVTGSPAESRENVQRDNPAQPPNDPTTFEKKITPYIPEKFQNTPFNEIPEDVIREAWDRYGKDWTKGVSEFGINDPRARRLMNIANIYEGNGPYFNQFQTFFTCLDRYGNNIMLTNVENTGVTFITRPRLCLQSTNIRSQRRMAVLDTSNPNTIAFAIRALLDTNLNLNGKYTQQLLNCPLVDQFNPFFTPLCNAMTSLSGLPDISIATETTDGGYMCEAQQYAVGGDDLQRGQYTLNLTFKDIQGGIISSIFYFWIEYIRCVTRGLMLAYPDDIDEQCLNYTVSIYHFNLDPTGQYITDWVKCTGCFPTTMPIGAKLQVNEGEFINRAADKLDVQFVCNKVEYRDYAIFMDFNTLMRRYCPTINQMKGGGEFQPGFNAQDKQTYTTADRLYMSDKQLINPTLPRVAWSNFRGLPWITSDVRGPKLEYRRVSNPVFPRNENIEPYDEDIGDQLLKTMIASDLKKNYNDVQNYMDGNYPEYVELAEQYHTDDLKNFVLKLIRSDVSGETSERIDPREAKMTIFGVNN